MTTKIFQNLKDIPLEGYKVEVKPLSPDWIEYSNYIVDYEKENLARTNRLIPPYVGSNNHGDDFYNDVIELVNELKPESVADLGCGAGELLSKIDCKEKYGLTLHVGEVKYAREVYKLENVVPADMRDIDLYFRPNSIEMVIAFWSFNYLNPEERSETMTKICRVLKPNKYFIYMDEYGHQATLIPENDEHFVYNHKETKWGRLSVLMKNVQ